MVSFVSVGRCEFSCFVVVGFFGVRVPSRPPPQGFMELSSFWAHKADLFGCFFPLPCPETCYLNVYIITLKYF